MPYLNKVFLLGNLTRDPERRTLPSGTAVTDLRLAATRKYRTAAGEDKEEPLFINVAFFGKQAETVAKYMQKGRPILVEGRLRLEEWKGKDGQNQSRISVIGDNFQFLGGGDRPARSSEMGDAPADAGRRPAPAGGGTDAADDAGGETGGDAGGAPDGGKDDDNLPF